ncbi:HK97 family phage prohead protease [Parvimonas micra]|uniref:HK97 family phage prohead protease n=1 Tax=Parvimonas micra TaxID=33033 RepID=UPI002B46B16F|nr:HK97 family phage prohead protease [Parvimonas micra]MEB3029101.1 HK97 family phage prohead protease [Parvimonas micra]
MILSKKLKNRQFRKLEDFKTDETKEDFVVRGYAAKFEPYILYEDEDGEVREQFNKNSFNDADLTDVIFLYDHRGKVLARNKNGTLKLKIDDIGLYVEADLSTSEAAREMYQEIKSGLVNKMSWSFKLGEYHFDNNTRTIIHDKIKKVYDVSAVGIPANNDTEINTRNFGDGVIDKIKAERLKNERKRKKLKLLIELVKE